MIFFKASNFKFIVELFGFGLCIAGVWYLIDFLSRIDLVPHLVTLSGVKLLGLIFLTICLTLAYTLIALCWRAILSDCGGQISLSKAQSVFSLSNLGKYVPGNFLHIAGRQVLAMREGLPGWIVAKSQVIEISLLALTSAVFVAIFWFISQFGDISIFVSTLTFPLIIVVSVFGLRWLGFPGSASAVLGYSVYHFVGGVVFALLFFLLSDDIPHDASLGFFLISAYVASWFIGLITPGAPAGLGVREAVLIGLLANVVPNEAILSVAVLLSRAMGFISDLAYFLIFHTLNVQKLSANE